MGVGGRMHCLPGPTLYYIDMEGHIYMALRFGIRFNDAFGSVREVVELAKLSEQAGFDVIWFCHDLFLRDAWVTLTAVAAATRTVQVGTCIVNPFTADPSEIAMHASTL